MEPIDYQKPNKKDVRWVVEREFDYLPAVDSAFSPHNMGWMRKALLKNVVLPRHYLNRLNGEIVCLDEKRIGYVFTQKMKSSIQIYSMGIIPEKRRKGIGRQTINYTIEKAIENEYSYLVASVTPENNAINKLFSSMGFVMYQSLFYQTNNFSVDGLEENDTHTVKEIYAKDLMVKYEKWLDISLAQGNSSIQKLIKDDHFRMSLKISARHWSCQVDGVEVGYLRISGLSKKVEIYLVLDQAYWDSNIGLEFIGKVLNSHPSNPEYVSLTLGSSAQLFASKNGYQSGGFEIKNKPRYLMVKTL